MTEYKREITTERQTGARDVVVRVVGWPMLLALTVRESLADGFGSTGRDG